MQLIMVRLRTANVSMAGGFHIKFVCQLLTRSFSLLFWQPTLYINSEDLFQPQNAKLAPEAPGADQPTVELFQPQLGQN